MWRVAFCVLVACHGAQPSHGDAGVDAIADAGVDTRPDARCWTPTECPQDTPYCLLGCSPAGACEQCGCQTTVSINYCSVVLCDPASPTCTKGDGSIGTCMQKQMSPWNPMLYWLCE